MQENESIMVVWCGQKNLSFGVTVWQSLVMPTVTLGQIFLSAPHTHERFL